MNQAKRKVQTILAAFVVVLLGLTATQSAVAQDTTTVAPQEMPATDGPNLDQLVSAIQDAEAQTAALASLTDLTVEDVQLVSVHDILQSEDDANAVNEALTASNTQVAALQAAVGTNQAVQGALGESVPTENVLAVEVQDDGSVIVFHQ